jgi:hypothetical protein
MITCRGQGDAGGAGLQRLQALAVVAHALGEQRDRPALPEVARARRDGVGVLRHLRLTAAIDGQGSDQGEEGTHDGMGPERALGQHPRPQPEEADEQHRIDQGVHVVGDDQDGPVLRQVLLSRDHHLAKERLEHHPGQAGGEGIACAPKSPSHAVQVRAGAGPRRSAL